jgi:hypothetical protein
LIRHWAVAALVCSAALAHAQSTAKKELVQKLLLQQQAALENVARGLVEQPAAQMMQLAGRALQSDVPADKREAVAKSIEADVKKYVDEALPLVKDRAIKAAPSTIGVALEEKFSEDELKQLMAWFDSPVNKKYQAMSVEMQKTFVQKVVADSRPLIEPKIQALDAKVRSTLGAAVGASAASQPPKGSVGAPRPATAAPKASSAP